MVAPVNAAVFSEFSQHQEPQDATQRAVRQDLHRLASQLSEEYNLGYAAAWKTAAKVMNATCAGIIAEELDAELKPDKDQMRLPGT